MPKSSLKLKLSLLLVLTLQTATLAALGPKEIENKLKEAKLLAPGEKIAAEVRNEEVVVYKFPPMQSNALEKDCKIDAILISKTVLDADPSAKRVKVRFIERADHSKFSEVLVGIAAIKGFATGTTTQDELLGSLVLTPGSDPNPPAPFASGTGEVVNANVVDGPYKAERADLFNQIHELENQNVNTTVYKNEFARLEELAKKGDKMGSSDLLDRLNKAVSDQLKAIAQKGKRPITTVASASAGTPSSAIPNVGRGEEEEHHHHHHHDDHESKLERLQELLGGGEVDEKQMMFTLGKMQLGDLAPAPGPYENERSLISRVLIWKRDVFRENIAPCIPMFRNLNTYAKTGDTKRMVAGINQFYEYLHISQQLIDTWKRVGPVQGWKLNLSPFLRPNRFRR